MAEQTQWAPTFNEQQTRTFINAYKKTPNRFDIEVLRNHAAYYNVPFYEGDFSILDAIKQAGGGFIEGFTTLKTIDPPDNEWEAVFRSVGHLAGFAPGILAGPAKFLGARGAAKFLAGKKGIPLYLAEKYITPKAAKLTTAAIQSSAKGRTGAVSDVAKFLLSPKAKHIAEGAFNLGTASGLSAWQSGVDEMMGSFFSGAVAGGVFRGIGNQINLQDPKAEKFARGLAGSLFMGIPSTVRGSSTPEQVYEYLMGAYFGGSEMPWTKARAHKFFGKMGRSKDPTMKLELDPRKQKGWEELEPEVQPEVEKLADEARGQTIDQHTLAAYTLAEEMGVLDKIPAEKEGETHQKVLENYNTIKTIVRAAQGVPDIVKPDEYIKVKDYDSLKEGETSSGISRIEILRKGELHPPGQPELAEKGYAWIKSPEVSKPEKPKNYIVTTGKSGAEAFATKQADKRNLSTVQVIFPGQGKVYGKQTATEEIVVGRQHFEDANRMLTQAVDNLRAIEVESGKKARTSIATLPEYVREALRRDAVNIKFTKDVFTIDRIADDFKTVAGKSKYAIQMGIDAGKNVSVFDKRFGWLKYDYKKKMFWTQTETPEISDRIAFFGKEKLEPIEKKAINELYLKYDKLGFKEEIRQDAYKKEDTYGFDTELLDVGEISSTPLDLKMQSFVTDFIRPQLKKTFKEPKELDTKTIEAVNAFGDTYLDFYNPGSKITKSNEWADAVETQLKVKVPQDLRNKMRQWLKIQNDGSPMRFIAGDGKNFTIANPNNPYTLAGKKKLVIVPNTPHEDLYMRLKGLVEKPKEGIYSILDHITIDGVDTDIVRIPEKDLHGKAIKSKYLSNVIKTMDKKYNMHIFSGQGDKDRIVFMKYHPNYKDVKLPTLPSGLYKATKDLYGMSKAEHDKAMKSTMAYKADLIGLPLKDIINKDGFINNAVNDNKRTQIWFTNGWKGDKEFLNNPKNVGKIKLSEKDDAKGFEGGNWTASLIADPKHVKNILNKLNIQLPQHVDGAIIMSEAEVDAMNLDAGVPYSGQNKSFITMPSADGTMLAKYMIHKASPAMSKAMNKAGTNMLIMSSAAKQRGNKKPGNYELIGDRKKGYELVLEGEAKNIFEINPEHVRYNHAVIQDKAMYGISHFGKVTGMKIVKQMMTNPHPDMHSPVEQKVIDDYFDTYSGNSFRGEFKFNTLVDNYVRSPSSDKIPEIVENLHLIGIPKIQKILQTAGQEKLATEMLKEILRVNKTSINELRAAGEESGTQSEETMKIMHSFSGTADNIIKYASAIKDGYPIFFDKYTKNYVTKSIDSYIRDRVLSPRVLNSLEARMRPYDKDLLITFPEFNDDAIAMKKHNRKADEIFMLGDLYETLPMRTLIPGLEKTILGKLWNSRNNPKYKKYKQDFKDIFEAISVRVPQDSPSGAQVLKFTGFTGIKDHGILQHGRVMEAEGGADLDADASFVYFGGMKENGSGFGMKNSFKEMYKAQKEEFYTTEPAKIKVTPKDRTEWAKNNLYKWKKMDTDYRETLKEIEFDVKDYKNFNDQAYNRQKNFRLHQEYEDYEYRGNKRVGIGEPLLEIHDVGNKFSSSFKKQGIYTLKEAQDKINKHWLDRYTNEIDTEIKKSKSTTERRIVDAKEIYKDEIVLSKDNAPKELRDMIDYVTNEGGKYPYLQYSPAVSLFAGQNAAKGRNTMAPVVSMTQSMRAAWSSLLHSKKGYDVIVGDDPKANYRIIVTPKPKSTDQVLYAKALVNFTADPMNEAGTIEYKDMKKGLMKRYFKTEEQFFDNKKKKWITSKKKLNTINVPRYNLINNVNKAFFGRNWDKNRSFTQDEKMDMISEISKYDANEFTTALPKFGHLLEGTDLSISIMNRLIPKTVKNIYAEHKEKVNKSEFKEYYKQILGRTNIREDLTPPVDFIFSEDLHRPSMIKETALLGDKEFFELLDKYKVNYKDKDVILKTGKEEYLRTLHNQVSDYFSNSLHNITSLNQAIQKHTESWAKGSGIEDVEMKRIIDFNEDIKKFHANRHHLRNQRGKPVDINEIQEAKDKILLRKAGLEIEKAGLLEGEVDKSLSSLESRSKIMDQAQIDGIITKFKESLSSEYARDMVDILLIGSFRTPDLQAKIKKAELVGIKTKDKGKKALAQEVIRTLYNKGSETGTSQLAFDSNAINPKNMLSFLNAKNKYFLKAQTKLTKEDKVELEKFDKDTDKFIPFTDIKDAGIAQELNGYEGLKKGTLTQEQKDVIKELTFHLKMEPDIRGRDLNEVLAGIYSEIDPEGIPKALNQMTVNDFKLINNWFKFIKSGTFQQKLEKMNSLMQQASVKKRHVMQFPKTVNREQMKFHIKFLPAEGYFITKDGAPSGKIMKPTYYGEVMQNYIGRMQDLSSGMTEKFQKDFRDEFQYLNQAKDDGGAIWRLAVRHHELAQRKFSPLYEQYFLDSKKNNKWDILKDTKYTVDVDGKRETYTGHQLKEMTRKKINDLMERYHTLVVGKEGALNRYITGWYDPAKKTQPILDYKTFIGDMKQAYNENKTIEMDLGFDGLRHMARSMTIDLLPITEYVGLGKFKGKKASIKEYIKFPTLKKKMFIPDREAQAEKYEKLVIQSTGHREGYFPHLFNSNKEIKKAFESEIKSLEQEGLSREEYKAKQQKIIMKYKMRKGDWDFADSDFWSTIDADVFDSIKERQNILKNKADLKTIEARTGNMFGRDEHMGGWIPEPEAVDMYIGNIVNAYYRQLANIMSRHTLNTMKNHLTKSWVDKAPAKEKESAKKLVKGWINHWRLFAREAMGNPTIIPADILNDPDMKISGTPYAWFADNLIAEKVDKIRKKLGLSKSSIPEEFQSIDAYDLRRWGNLEGKYQLATLMTHPKTMINNIFGGTMHTFQSVGYEPLRKARNIEFLKTINPKLDTIGKWTQFVEELGVLPEMAMHEFGLQKEFRSGKGLAFVKDLSKQAGSAKSLKDLNIVDLAQKHGITNAIMEKAAKFMTIPERMLRRDSFLAHYIKAWERFGGAIKDPKHPFLVEQAKKGVKATQFLYSAPYRPAFARSGLGKIMARFQLWSWNAVRFRNDLRNQAKIYGFKPGTEAMTKFERTMRTDMFVLALSGVFMYSIFEQVLPAPWNWLQDTAQWLFGDEKERDRAFFGTWPSAVAPLQMITPPIARFPISIIREFAEDDYTKLADYYSWTMFPFGRMIRDIAHPETGLIRNPMRFPEKVFGFPMIGLSKEAKKIKEQDYKAPTPGISKLKY